MARTTLILEDSTLDKVRELAHRENRPMSDIVNELLAEGLYRRRQPGRKEDFELPSFSMGKTRVNLADRDALEARMEQQR